MMNRPYRILVVEDSETQALKLCYALEQKGWQVDTVATADKALDMLNVNLPDLVVVDYHLPGMQGDELCRRIRMKIDTRSVPILMLTIDDSYNSEQHGLESGADDYISKSVDPDILLLRIHALLRKSRGPASILDFKEAYFQKAKLLLVDDSLTFLEYLGSELEAEGYTVKKVSSGITCLDCVMKDDFDCVLVDLIMPEMDGIEVCLRLTELRRTMDNPIVVMMLTAKETKEDMTKGLEAGADDFVGKSNDMAVLKARIRALLRRKFFQEENQRILQELTERELEAVRARAAQEAAEAKVALAEELEVTNRELAQTNQKLKETQTQLVQFEKMASLGQLVAGIAHEINNPLAFVLNNLFSVQNWLEQISTEVKPLLTSKSLYNLEKVRSRLQDMQEGLDRVKELILKLRTFSRLDEGEFKTVDIHESIDSVLLFLKHKMKDRIAIEKNYGYTHLLSCYAGQLNQVIMNIVANAVDAIEGSGKIAITTAEMNEMFVLSIRDSGKGIPDSIRDRIFEPFFTTKEIGKGTGLGLAISYGIIQAHKGTIEIHSQEEHGTEFLIKIPLNLQQKISAKNSVLGNG